MDRNLLLKREDRFRVIKSVCVEDSILIKEIESAQFYNTEEPTKVIGLDLYNKERIFTTLVRIKGAKCNVVPVKSSKPIHKDLWIDCSKALSRLYVGAPIKIGDIVCKNILNTGVNIICTKNVDKI